MNAKKYIVVVGSSNTDMIVKVPKLPEPGETVLGGAFLTAPGGKGANQAVAAARSGGAVAFVAKVGTDALGDEAIANYKREGIDTNYILRDPEAPSGVALIFVAQDGQNSICVAPGANGKLKPEEIKTLESTIASAAVLIAQLETPIETVREALRLASKHRVPLILNPAPAREIDDEILKHLEYLTPNCVEAEALSGVAINSVEDAKKAAKALRNRGVGHVIVTLGAEGAFISGPEIETHVKGIEAKAVDATAAGDTFTGAFATALSEGMPLTDAVRFANAAAAISVTRMGAQPSIPTKAEIEGKLNSLGLRLG
jgi:ribokinase